ncbi:protein FAR1-RELATED SEQUENCE 2-like [Pyrus communis]|uniref:protein FAR1-RELATED SEQUENCE 2-like n=1 Tax=Pyrus communis TaxID=23211 RepID=UPI0035BEE32C
MLSLTEKNFQSREDLLGIVREIALKQGYATVIRRSKADKYVIIGCDRGGNYRNTNLLLEDKKRKTASRLINCPFEIWGKKKQEGFWKVDIKNLSHNHDPSTDMSGHPYYRRFSEDEILRIKQMTMAGGRTVVQALLDELGQGGFTYNIEYDQNDHLTHLFFAHSISIAMTKSYSNVFVMDCTYKTNKYKMPLLDIIGVSSFNTSFYSCFAFMQKEEEEDYVWALSMFSKLLGIDNHPVAIISDRELALMKAIESVFPRTTNILCVWHIEKNILTNYSGLHDFENGTTNRVSCQNDIEYSEHLADSGLHHFENGTTNRVSCQDEGPLVHRIAY